MVGSRGTLAMFGRQLLSQGFMTLGGLGLCAGLLGCKLVDDSLNGSIGQDSSDLLVSVGKSEIRYNEFLPIQFSSGNPPYTVEVLQGSGYVSADGQSYVAGSALEQVKLKVTDSESLSQELEFRTIPNPGVPDESYTSGGYSAYLVGGAGVAPYDLAELPDGKVLVCGYRVGGTFTALRIDTDSTLDTTFGSGTGFVEKSVGGTSFPSRIHVLDNGSFFCLGSNDGDDFPW